MEYYIAVGGQTHGPYLLEDLKAWQAKGELDLSAQIWDGQLWQPAQALLGPPPPSAPPDPPKPPPKTDEIFRELERFAGSEVSSFRSNIKILYMALMGSAVCVGLYFGVWTSSNAMMAADVKNSKTMLIAVMAQEPITDPATGGPKIPPVSAKARPLPADMEQSYRAAGLINKWGHPTEYVCDGNTYRLILPIGKNKDGGYIIGNPMGLGTWYWSRDSGPITWEGVKNMNSEY